MQINKQNLDSIEGFLWDQEYKSSSILEEKYSIHKDGVNEIIASFISRIKDMKKKLADISEIVADTDLVMITMNGMTDDYQMFITGISARDKISKFEELTWLLMQEEGRRLTWKPQSAELALMEKNKFFKAKGNPSQKNGGNP